MLLRSGYCYYNYCHGVNRAEIKNSGKIIDAICTYGNNIPKPNIIPREI